MGTPETLVPPKWILTSKYGMVNTVTAKNTVVSTNTKPHNCRMHNPIEIISCNYHWSLPLLATITHH